MFELTVEAEFCAAHAIRIAGAREQTHGHNWHVTAAFAGPGLDPDGLLVDFHRVEANLREICGVFNNRDLNRTAPFDSINPTAENVAAHIASRLAASLSADPPGNGVRVLSVRVTEAPGCAVTFRP